MKNGEVASLICTGVFKLHSSSFVLVKVDFFINFDEINWILMAFSQVLSNCFILQCDYIETVIISASDYYVYCHS